MGALQDSTNPSKEQEMLYGHHTGGLFGYSHLTGGWDGGQAEYARVPFGARPLHNRLALPVLLCCCMHVVCCARGWAVSAQQPAQGSPLGPH